MSHTIYLSGPSSREAKETFAWRNAIIDEFPEQNFINPYTFGDAGYDESPEEIRDKQERAMDEADGVVTRWNTNSFNGTVVEARMAHENGIPNICVNEIGEEVYFGKVLSAYWTLVVEGDQLAATEMCIDYLQND